MKKLSILLLICILCASIPFSVVAEAPATADWPYEAEIDYESKKVLATTDYMLNLSQYMGEGPFDLYGVPVSSLKLVGGGSEEEFFSKYGFCYYSIILEPEITVKDAVTVLTSTGKFTSVGPNWYVYIDGEEPSRWRKGDINRDGTIDAFDCLKVKGWYFGTANLSEIQIERADVNKDGEIDMFDYLEVKSIYFEQ